MSVEETTAKPGDVSRKVQPLDRLIDGLTPAEYQRKWRKDNPEKYRKHRDKAYAKRRDKEKHEHLHMMEDECKCIECEAVFDRTEAHARGFRFVHRYLCVCDFCEPNVKHEA